MPATTTSAAVTGDAVPFVLYDSRENRPGSGLDYSERNGLKGPMVSRGIDLMPLLFEKM